MPHGARPARLLVLCVLLISEQEVNTEPKGGTRCAIGKVCLHLLRWKRPKRWRIVPKTSAPGGGDAPGSPAGAP